MIVLSNISQFDTPGAVGTFCKPETETPYRQQPYKQFRVYGASFIMVHSAPGNEIFPSTVSE